jgi:DNA-directed RNA polymerase specialized sigma24 family protein
MKNYEAHQELIEIFEKNSSELYQLAFLLTGNTDRSVEAFSKAIDYDDEENPVFGGFMNAWARKLIIVEALGTMEKELRVSKQRVARTAADEAAGDANWKRRAHIAREEFEEAVVAIDAFPRCAMLLTIFEGMSIEGAASLLNTDESSTAAAQRIGIVQLTRNLAGSGERDPYGGMNPVPVLSLS